MTDSEEQHLTRIFVIRLSFKQTSITRWNWKFPTKNIFGEYFYPLILFFLLHLVFSLPPTIVQELGPLLLTW